MQTHPLQTAMSRYFGERAVHTPADMVLREEYWKGQVHGSSTETIVHSRYLRPLCDRFSTGESLSATARGNFSLTCFPDLKLSYTDKSRKNMVLFMPYLHWDTDRNRAKMTEVVRQRTNRYVRDSRKTDSETKANDKERRESLHHSCLPRIRHELPNYYDHDNPQSEDLVPETMEEIIWQKLRNDTNKDALDTASGSEGTGLENSHILPGVVVDKWKRLRPHHRLGRLLIDAARLYEAIATFRDRQVLDEYLFSDSPVHPRRSLDQGYFWKLRTTFRRDRDQVVYRYTKPVFHHRFIPPERQQHRNMTEIKASLGGKGLREQAKFAAKALVGEVQVMRRHFFGNIRTWKWESGEQCDIAHQECKEHEERLDGMRGWQWTHHTKYEDKHGCEECRAEIRKLSRAVMVDQLWMWILDENTILTCFPGRYGVGKKDPSGVHHSIRRRMKEQSNSANNLRSVFDLGLIVLEECFDTFFDRTKTPDGRPQILDMFAESIGKIVSWNHYSLRFYPCRD